MKSATRTAASAVGTYAGLLGAAHGYFETRQGNFAPQGMMINAVGVPCQPESIWHACFPAMTLIPNLLAAGVITLLAALAVLVWAAAFIGRKRGGLALILLSVVLLLAGGGFIPPMLGIIAGMVGTRIHTPFTWWRTRLSPGLLRALAALWPWALIAYLAWILIQLLLGTFFNAFLLNLGFVSSLISNILLLLSIFSAFAHDARSTPG